MNADVEEQVEIQTKYEGYINKSLQQVEKVKRMEEKIPEDLDYSKIDSLATEAREKLSEVKPLYCKLLEYRGKSSRHIYIIDLLRTR